MKVVLDLSRLLRDGKISQEEFDRLSRLAARRLRLLRGDKRPRLSLRFLDK